MKKIVTALVAIGTVSIASVSAPPSARAMDPWTAAAWFTGGLVVGAAIAPAFAYAPGYSAGYYPYETSYGYRAGYGYPYGYNPRYANPFNYDYVYRPYGVPASYGSVYAWAGPPCQVRWARYAGDWRSARTCY